MARLLNCASIAFSVLIAQAASPSSGQERAAQKKTSEAPTPSLVISGTKTFAPSKGETSLPQLLATRSVQRELGLTDDQAKKIEAVYNSQVARRLPVFRSYRNSFNNPEKRDALKAELGDMSTRFDREIKEKLSRVQARRLTEIAMQNAGLRAILFPGVFEALNVAPDRQEAIEEIINAYEAREKELETEVKQAETREFAKLPRGNWEKYQRSKEYVARHEKYNEARAANRANARREILRLLTKRQQNTLNDMLGAPFDPEKHRKPEDKQPGENR